MHKWTLLSCVKETTSICITYLSHLHVPLETTQLFGLHFNIRVQKFNNQILSGYKRNQILILWHSVHKKRKKECMEFQRDISLRLIDCPKNLKEILLPCNAKQVKDQNLRSEKAVLTPYSCF